MPVVVPISQLISASLLCALAWVSWKCFQRFVLNSPLDNIPGPPSDSFVTGMYRRFFSYNTNDYLKELLEKYGTVIKITRHLGKKALYVSDPKALHNIIVKDQHIYEETPEFLISNRCVFGPGLLSTLGEVHRKQRRMLSPVFSTSHMRQLMPILYPIVYKIKDVFTSKTKDGPQEIEFLSWMSRTALEMIGQSGFGYSFDDLTENAVEHPFASCIRRTMSVALDLIILRNLLLLPLSKITTRRFRRFLVDHLPWKSLQDFAKIVDLMHETALEVHETKKRALEEGDEIVERQIAKGKDVMSILMRANTQANEDDKLSEEELLAQLTTFAFAGTDTTSLTLSRIIWVLAQRQDAQDKICDEIRNARKRKEGGGDLTYDELVNLPYLDAVCRETLRLYPPINNLTRATTQDVVLPLGTPIKGLDGKEITEIPIPKGTQVMVGVLASNINPEIWGSDSYEWKPERWLDTLPESLTAARIPGVYSNLLTFFGGGRACIGFKFAQLEIKMVLSLFLESFKFSLSDKKLFWKTVGVASPALVSDPSVRQMPLMVEQRR